MMTILKLALSANAALALLGGWCEAQRVTTGTSLTPQGGQLFAKDAAGKEFPHVKFASAAHPSGGPWTLEECRLKALAVCKPDSSLGIWHENSATNSAFCWVVGQSYSDFVNTTGASASRGIDNAVLPITNPPLTGDDTLSTSYRRHRR